MRLFIGVSMISVRYSVLITVLMITHLSSSISAMEPKHNNWLDRLLLLKFFNNHKNSSSICEICRHPYTHVEAEHFSKRDLVILTTKICSVYPSPLAFLLRKMSYDSKVELDEGPVMRFIKKQAQRLGQTNCFASIDHEESFTIIAGKGVKSLREVPNHNKPICTTQFSSTEFARLKKEFENMPSPWRLENK